MNKKTDLGWDLWEFTQKMELMIFLSVTIYTKLDAFTLIFF
ncbi:hypothetical protein LYNGBM3L_41150 [Moorena producens 3L]|uniref:Uncharacterized protein n=1 Tax=Moorena producens 3L TaxID=489825 RepID=F4XVW3_9CYAN|nr:hypothetical protein LYNGBM3L_41150 [Moorena producens 3L]